MNTEDIIPLLFRSMWCPFQFLAFTSRFMEISDRRFVQNLVFTSWPPFISFYLPKYRVDKQIKTSVNKHAFFIRHALVFQWPPKGAQSIQFLILSWAQVLWVVASVNVRHDHFIFLIKAFGGVGAWFPFRRSVQFFTFDAIISNQAFWNLKWTMPHLL